MSTPPRPPRPTESRTLSEVPPEPVHNSQEPPKVRSPIPGTEESGGMFFEIFIFNPDETIPKADLIEVLKAAKFQFAPSVFEKLPESAKRHFLRMDRTGAIQKYKPNTQTRRG